MEMNMSMKIGAYLAAGMLAVPLLNNATNPGEESQKMPVPAGFIVVDSTGKTVGPVIGTLGTQDGEGASTYAAVSFNGKWLPIQVRRTQLGSPADDLYFETPDCSGQAFATTFGDQSSLYVFPVTAVVPKGATLYFESGPSETIMIGSEQLFNGSCSSFSLFPLNVVPMTAGFDLSVFTPPFRAVPSRMKIIP